MDCTVSPGTEAVSHDTSTTAKKSVATGPSTTGSGAGGGVGSESGLRMDPEAASGTEDG